MGTIQAIVRASSSTAQRASVATTSWESQRTRTRRKKTRIRHESFRGQEWKEQTHDRFLQAWKKS